MHEDIVNNFVNFRLVENLIAVHIVPLFLNKSKEYIAFSSITSDKFKTNFIIISKFHPNVVINLSHFSI